MSEYDIGTYEVTFWIEVEEAGWSKSFTIEFVLDQLLRWDGYYGIRLLT